MIKMIYASDINGVIGKNNKLIWDLPSDLRRFKELTIGHFVVMGRNTYESLPECCRPLPGRSNIVLSTTSIIKHPDVITLSSLKNLMIVAKLRGSIYSKKDIWIIGGAKLYETAIQYVDEIHHTKILEEYEGDTTFDISKYSSEFNLDSSELVKHSETQCLDYQYNIYKRNR